jgi:hypothetical protein
VAWRLGGGREKEQVQDAVSLTEGKLTGKDLERAQQMVKEMLKADREVIERNIIPSIFPGAR